MSQTQNFRLGGESAKRSFLFGLTGVGVAVLGAYIGLSVILVIFVRSKLLLATLAIVGLSLFLLMRQSSTPGSASLLSRAAGWARHQAARRRGFDAFAKVGGQVVPRPVGPVLFFGVAPAANEPEQAVVRHKLRSGAAIGQIYYSTVVEVDGRGDGELPAGHHMAQAIMLQRVLTTMANVGSLVDQLDFTTRVLPGMQPGYTDQLLAMVPDHVRGTVLADNMEQLLANLEWSADQYRHFVTISLPADRVNAVVERTGEVTRSRIADAVYAELGRVHGHLESAGFTVRNGMGPRRLGAYIRHLYQPSWGIDDLTGIAKTSDGFVPYPVPLHDALRVPDHDHDVLWHHATARVPIDAWPPTDVDARWMRGLVLDVVEDDLPSVIRTITSQYRLVPRREARRAAIAGVAHDLSEVHRRRGAVTGREWEAQADVGQLVLDDLVYAQAGGVRPSIRVTCSTPSASTLPIAREAIEAGAGRMNLERLEWMDGRQADAFCWSLPLGRGLRRS